MSITIESGTDKKFIDNIADKPLSFLIQQAGFPLDLQCSGLGICKKCAVELGRGRYRISGKETVLTDGETLTALSCRTFVMGNNASVNVPRAAVLNFEGKIYDDFQLDDYSFSPVTRKHLITVPEPTLDEPTPDWDRVKAEIAKACGLDEEHPFSWDIRALRKIPLILKETLDMTVTVGRFQGQRHLIEVEAGDTCQENLGVAVDIGTTTVALVLVDMNSGKILGRESSYNQQMSRADDVASRISVASASEEQLRYMKDLVINDTINPLIKKVCRHAGRNPQDIFRLQISGNTVMSHLFLGLSPDSIGKLPFQPVTNLYADCLANDLGLLMHDCGVVSIAPSISGYIGGDITCDLHVTGIMKDDQKLTAMIDLGTNSEMVLIDGDQLYACAAAAGPAFEGAGTQCGCRATAGAIEHIQFDESLDFKIDIIDDAPPIGLCGSAIIDFLACGFACGLINEMGRFDIDLLKKRDKFIKLDVEGRALNACLLVDGTSLESGKSIIVTEVDVEQILKAKAAVYAGLKTLLTNLGKSFQDLDRMILAGGFAKYIKLENAVTIGMIPDIPNCLVESVGNGSLGGAFLSLVDDSTEKALRNIIRKPRVIPLNLIPDFEMNYVDALMLPGFNQEEFPNVMKRLGRTT